MSSLLKKIQSSSLERKKVVALVTSILCVSVYLGLIFVYTQYKNEREKYLGTQKINNGDINSGDSLNKNQSASALYSTPNPFALIKSAWDSAMNINDIPKLQIKETGTQDNNNEENTVDTNQTGTIKVIDNN